MDTKIDNAIARATRTTLSRIPTGTPVTLIHLDRYTQPRVQVGVHIVTYPVGGFTEPNGQYTVGLVPLENLNAALRVFAEIEDTDWNPDLWHLTDQQADLQAYTRRQVIPLEWKSMSDDELNDRIHFRHGITKAPAWGIIESTIGLDGASTVKEV
jgi:hypothetical protein